MRINSCMVFFFACRTLFEKTLFANRVLHAKKNTIHELIRIHHMSYTQCRTLFFFFLFANRVLHAKTNTIHKLIRIHHMSYTQCRTLFFFLQKKKIESCTVYNSCDVCVLTPVLYFFIFICKFTMCNSYTVYIL